ncbi:MAG: septum formation protein Maf [Lentisphaeria bacterium]|nr:septum formation protein Maf [Lentisphaeria bacterium]
MELILASQSPRRCELLQRCGFDFTIRTAEVEELTCLPDLAKLPQENARRKAAAVAASYPDALVLGADTMIIFENQAVGKPHDLDEAAEFLRRFSGKMHEVVTGLALLCPARDICDVWSEVSQVTFKKLTPEVIAEYLQKVPVLDKAGAYAIQEHGDMIVADYTGELENIIGLPLIRLRKRLAELL